MVCRVVIICVVTIDSISVVSEVNPAITESNAVPSNSANSGSIFLSASNCCVSAGYDDDDEVWMCCE